MPYKSEKQRRYVNMKAKEGAKWAKKFKSHSEGGKKKGKKKRK